MNPAPVPWPKGRVAMQVGSCGGQGLLVHSRPDRGLDEAPGGALDSPQQAQGVLPA